MKRNLLLLLILASCSLSASAQTARETISRNPRLALPTYGVYVEPEAPVAAAPRGYKPFYVSHLGRHGSRNQLSQSFYGEYVELLERIDSAGYLTPLGREVKEILAVLRDGEKDKAGELTELGLEQHRGIAHRMYRNFKRVFRSTEYIDVRSSKVMRCAFSMFGFCDGLKEYDGRLKMKLDASDGVQLIVRPQYHGPRYTEKFKTEWARHMSPESAWHKGLNEWGSRHECPHAVSMLLTDPEAAMNEFGLSSFFFSKDIHSRLCFAQNAGIDTDALVSRIFDDDEIYLYYCDMSYYWLHRCACTEDSMCVRTISRMRPLVEDFVTRADEAIGGKAAMVDLRFAHDSQLTPLMAAMGFDGYSLGNLPVEEVAEKWAMGTRLTMAANLQMVLYRKGAGDDILVRFLLNEQDVTLPVESDAAPFYRWKDVKKHLFERLDSIDSFCEDIL